MDQINDARDCYQWYKKFYLDNNLHFSLIDFAFIDQVIFNNDKEMYFDCQDRVSQAIPIVKSFCKDFPNRTDYKKELELWEIAQHALVDNARDDYLNMLEKRKKKNFAFLCKKHKKSIETQEKNV